MAYNVTASEVANGFSLTTSEADIWGYIEVVSQADECMTSNEVPDVVGQRLKIIAVRHLATLVGSDGSGGQLSSQRATSGAARAFNSAPSSQGTTYGLQLKQLDRWGCVLGIIENNANFSLRSIGRRPQRSSTF